jgi:hypothetical protein
MPAKQNSVGFNSNSKGSVYCPARRSPSRDAFARQGSEGRPMKEQDPNFRYIEAPGDARDILARLYREIGISAVAAALQATQPKPIDKQAEEAKRPLPRRFDGRAA